MENPFEGRTVADDTLAGQIDRALVIPQALTHCPHGATTQPSREQRNISNRDQLWSLAVDLS